MLKIYLKSDKRLFLEYQNEVLAYTFDNILDALNDIKNKYEINQVEVLNNIYG